MNLSNYQAFSAFAYKDNRHDIFLHVPKEISRSFLQNDELILLLHSLSGSLL